MIAMCGGGTGGHLVIIKAVKEEINSPIVYIGSTKGQDTKWFKDDTKFKERYFLETRGVVNQTILGKVVSLYMLFKATLKAKKILEENKIKVVFSVGGFSSAPTAFASKILNIPLVIHEQNAHIGSLNRLLKPYAKYFISSYDKNSPIKDYPVSREFFKKARVRKELKTIIFLGGSQGAVAINRVAKYIAKELNNRGIKIIHQAGERNIEETKKSYPRAFGIKSRKYFGGLPKNFKVEFFTKQRQELFGQFWQRGPFGKAFLTFFWGKTFNPGGKNFFIGSPTAKFF